MAMRRVELIACTLFFLLVTVVANGQEPADRFEKVVKRMAQAINAGDYSAAQEDFSQMMLGAVPLEKWKPFCEGLVSQCGKIEKLDPPRPTLPSQALFPAHFERAFLDIKIVLDEQDKIVGLWFLPHTPPIPVPDKHLTTLGLPFRGEWFVCWGGDTKELNQHHDVQNQRFAFDFVAVDTAGKTYKNDGKENEDYYAFGQVVLAPADGVVTDVITGVRDNVPGSMNPYAALGNAVVIEHREHEVSVLAHFKNGSIQVKTGDKVKRGQILGRCGNSGNSSESHIHYHLQNTPVIQDGTGIRCLFDKVSVMKNRKCEAKSNHSPVKGDVIKQE